MKCVIERKTIKDFNEFLNFVDNNGIIIGNYDIDTITVLANFKNAKYALCKYIVETLYGGEYPDYVMEHYNIDKKYYKYE